MEKQNTSVIQKLIISYECALAIGNSLNLSEMLHDVIHTIVHKTNAHRGSIWLRDEKNEDYIKLGARAGSLLTEAEIKKRASAFQDIFEKIWKNKLPVIKNRDDKDFFQYCFKITGKEQSVLIVPVKNVAILKLVYTNKDIVNETLANMLLSLSEKLSMAINACLAHENIKKEIQIRKETEALLKHSEQQYRSTIDSIGKAIHVVDENLNIVLFNKTFKQWNKELGFETENLIGRNSFDIFPFLPDTVRDEYEQVFKTGKMLITTETNKFAGKEIITETRKIPILENKKVVRVVTVIDDITERKQADEELKQSEEKYHSLIDNIQDGVFVIQNAKMQFVNEAFARMVGYTVDEIIGTDFRELVAPEDRDMVADSYRRRQAGEDVPREYEFRMLHKDGETRVIVNMNVGLIPYQGKIASMGTVKDITEQKQIEEELKKKTEQIISDKEKIEELYKNSEENRKSLLSILEDVSEKEKALRESEERFQNIVANTGDWIWETDVEGRYTYSSPIVKQVLGYEYQEMLGKHFYDLALPDEQDKFKKTAFESSKKKEKVKNLVSQNVHKDGHIVSLETNAVPLLDDKGNLLGYRGVTRDITERKRAEQIQSVLYHITNAVNTTKDLNELLKIIHKQLGTIIDTTNYYVALYDKETDTISLPYDVDQKDKFVSFPAGKTLTSYVIKTGKSLLADEEVSEKLTQAGEVETVGTPSKIWLGVPLKIANEVIGVVAVQSYTDASLYTEKDLAILEFVSDAIAIAIEHQRADEAIKESEEKFRSVVENSHEGIFIIGKDYRFIYVNDELCQILGYPDEEIIGQDFRKFLDENSKKLVSDRYIRRQKGEDIPHRYEFNIMRKDGRKRQVEISSSIIKDSKGEIFTVAQILDITERKQAEKLQATIYKISDAVNTTTNLDELYQTIHQHLSTVIDTTNFYIALYDEDKDILSFPYYIDEKDTQPVSHKPSKGLTEYVMRTGKSLFAPKEYYMKLVKEGKIELSGTPSEVWIGVPLKTADKTIGVIAVQSYTDASIYTEKDVEILEFASDQIAIAIERKRAEEARRKSEKHFRDTIENIFKFVPDGLLVFTDKLNLFRENKAFQDIIQKYAAKLNYTEPELKKIITEKIKNKILKKDHTEIRISKKYDK